MTPDKPYTLAVCIICSILVYVLKPRHALIPLAVAMCCYPSNLLLPPDGIGLTAQRVIAMILLIRCLTTSSIRAKFKWGIVDTMALAYFLLLLVSMMGTQGPGKAINNRGGFFMSAMAPFWCVRMLITDRESLYALLKGWLWCTIPLAAGGLYQWSTGNHPYYSLMPFGVPPIDGSMMTRTIYMRMSFGSLHYRANCPFLHAIMFGWFFAILMAWSTTLYFEKRKMFPWIIPWAVGIPLGIISSISGGPIMMVAISLMFLSMFPIRHMWRLGLIIAGVLVIAFSIVSNKNPMELLASVGFDQASSWYRVGLSRHTLNGGMSGYWLMGYGDNPPMYSDGRVVFHDLCIHWVYLVVFHGLMGLVGFYGLVVVCGMQLWKASKRVSGLADEWVLWAMMSTLVASIWAMLMVALFGEMQFIYHMFLAVVANAPMFVGATTRRVGVMAQVDGKPTMLVYNLKPGQKLAIMSTGAAVAEEDEPTPGSTIPINTPRAVAEPERPSKKSERRAKRRR